MNTLFDSDYSFNDAKASLLEENGMEEVSDSQVYDYISDIKDMEFNDVIYTIEHYQRDNSVIAVADLGLWTGRHSGYKVYNNFKDAVTGNIMRSYSDLKIYIDDEGDIWREEYHHDGVSRVCFRYIKKSVSDKKINDLLDDIYNDNDYDLDKLTFKCSKEIKKYYGIK